MWYLTLTFCAILTQHGRTLAYRAAVVEYVPQALATPEATIAKNLEEYTAFADQARRQSADIIVFPEYGLTTAGVDPRDFFTEISNDSHVITKLSGMAKERQMYVVVNLLEKAQNASRIYYYNTNLVFDRNGTIVKTYRKINLYNESSLTPGAKDQDLTFSTDFGTTFAIFTCFDILFKNPARTVLENPNVTDVIFPTAWLSKMPFYLALSVQHGYSVETGVNLLAANYAKPKDGRGGSGIYLSDGTIEETYLGDTLSSKLIVRDVARITKRGDRTACPSITPFGLPGGDIKSNVSDFVTEKTFDASKYQFKSVDLTQSKIETEICDRKFCCTFEILVSNNQSDLSESYKLMAFDGIVDYEGTQARIRVCSLVACENSNSYSCGARINGTTKFTKISVKGNLAKDPTAFYSPITANSFLLPITRTSYCDTNNATNSSFVQLATMRQQANVLVFGIFGKTELLVDPEDPEHTDDDNSDGGNDDGGNGSADGAVQSGLIAALVFALLSFIDL